ncbi:hypothetical protein NUSPORA_02518 [Nucleospora cyclopteri]
MTYHLNHVMFYKKNVPPINMKLNAILIMNVINSTKNEKINYYKIQIDRIVEENELLKNFCPQFFNYKEPLNLLDMTAHFKKIVETIIDNDRIKNTFGFLQENRKHVKNIINLINVYLIKILNFYDECHDVSRIYQKIEIQLIKKFYSKIISLLYDSKILELWDKAKVMSKKQQIKSLQKQNCLSEEKKVNYKYAANDKLLSTKEYVDFARNSISLKNKISNDTSKAQHQSRILYFLFDEYKIIESLLLKETDLKNNIFDLKLQECMDNLYKIIFAISNVKYFELKREFFFNFYIENSFFIKKIYLKEKDLHKTNNYKCENIFDCNHECLKCFNLKSFAQISQRQVKELIKQDIIGNVKYNNIKTIFITNKKKEIIQENFIELDRCFNIIIQIVFLEDTSLEKENNMIKLLLSIISTVIPYHILCIDMFNNDFQYFKTYCISILRLSKMYLWISSDSKYKLKSFLLDIITEHINEIQEIIFVFKDKNIQNQNIIKFLELIIDKNKTNKELINGSESFKNLKTARIIKYFVLEELLFEIYLHENFNNISDLKNCKVIKKVHNQDFNIEQDEIIELSQKECIRYLYEINPEKITHLKLEKLLFDYYKNNYEQYIYDRKIIYALTKENFCDLLMKEFITKTENFIYELDLFRDKFGFLL